MFAVYASWQENSKDEQSGWLPTCCWKLSINFLQFRWYLEIFWAIGSGNTYPCNGISLCWILKLSRPMHQLSVSGKRNWRSIEKHTKYLWRKIRFRWLIWETHICYKSINCLQMQMHFNLYSHLKRAHPSMNKSKRLLNIFAKWKITKLKVKDQNNTHQKGSCDQCSLKWISR